jgi:hypothetical protein
MADSVTTTTWVVRDADTGLKLCAPDEDETCVRGSLEDPRGYPRRQLVRIDTTVTETIVEERVPQ